MTDLERSALLGDRKAQGECTQQGIVLPCPHCRGNAKVSFKDARFIGQNAIGDKKLVYRVQVICNKCRSRGKPIFTEPLINPKPYFTKWGTATTQNMKNVQKKQIGFCRMCWRPFLNGTPAQRRQLDGVGSALIILTINAQTLGITRRKADFVIILHRKAALKGGEG